MLFNSLRFLYVFLPITYAGFWLLHRKTHRYFWLALTGYLFYASWNYKFCALMAFSTAVAYLAGHGLLRWQGPRLRLLCLVVPVTADLALLGFFKYWNFAVDNANHATAWLGIPAALPLFDIVLPVGISFYTFHTVTYIVDSYRGLIKPTRNVFEFACYVSLFAQLVAGPIVRFRQIEGDLDRIDRVDRRNALNVAWSFFAIGLAKKVLLADSIAAIVNPAFLRYEDLGTLGTWACMLGFTYQLYFDFSGYSDMAVGLGYLFGLRLPQNFNSPYKALDPADFWRRWHISLSSFLRDYVYIPLGGSRCSPLAANRNLLVTMLLGGLWHGANWTFVVWGGYHGVLLVLHRLVHEPWDRLSPFARRLTTFVLVVVGLVFFRAGDFTMAATMLQRMFVWHSGAAPVGGETLVVLLGVAAVLAHVGPNTFEFDHAWSAPAVAGLALLFVLCLVSIAGFEVSPFLYFQF